jgi:hypothetical protein
MTRAIFILFFGATIAFLLGKGYYESFRSGVLTIKGRTYRRDEEPTLYWISMVIGAFAFLLMMSVTAVMAFLVCMHLFGTSK